MIKALKIRWLKFLLKRQYLRWLNMRDTSECGTTLLLHMSGKAFDTAKRCDDLMDKLAKLDPNTPSRRILRSDGRIA